jgi:sigma-54 specific flagellar transcriptional regulator A
MTRQQSVSARLTMPPLPTADPTLGTVCAPADETVARRSSARLLISAATAAAAATIARRIHDASSRTELPFVQLRAGDFPIDPGSLKATCARVLEVATGGTLFISDVETLPPLVQYRLIELLEDLERARAPQTAVRLIAGTTVPLFARVTAGRFSELLFYRLNILHLKAGEPTSDQPREGW